MKIESTLLNSFLFSGMTSDEVCAALKEAPPTVRGFKRGDLVYSSSSDSALVGFVLSGRCEIRIDRDGGNKTLLNVLEVGGSFGILSVYSADQFPTQVVATKNSEIILFTDEQIRYFVNNYSQISSNLIVFLANRIAFLNKKIATFSANRVEDRLAAFLLSESEKQSSTEFAFNCNKTAEKINAGRASVYRALASLEESGLITLIDKKINIKDLEGLERIVK